jgi:alpha-N-arabinofuranosidase
LPTLVSTTTGEIDFIALHNAFAPLILESYDFSNASNRRAAYESMFARAQMTGDDIAAVNSQWVRTRGGAPPRIAITEHFPLFGAGGGPAQLQAILDQSRTQAAALYTASLIHEFMRREVWMANYNLATSKWFGALLTDTERGIVKTPTYHVYDLYRNHFGTALIAVTAEGPQFDTRQVGSVAARKDVPYLDVIASKDGAGNVYLAVINRSGERPVEAEIRFANPVSANATVMTLAAQSLDAINGPALGPTVRADANIDIRSSRWTGKPGATYAFPAASVTIFRWAM